MSDIQKARDVLAKWRENITSGQWNVTVRDGSYFDVIDNDGFPIRAEADYAQGNGFFYRDGDAALIVGTAGNPDLLDAIDGMLDASASSTELSPFDAWGKRLAAAIIAADERMSA